jgi:ferredoxin
MLDELIKNGIPAWVLLAVAAGVFIYMIAAVWSHLEAGSMFWQNLRRANRVALPDLGHAESVPATGTATSTETTVVLSRAAIPVNLGTGNALRDTGNVIYPVAGRNGLHFDPQQCTSCGLCVFVCPTKAVSTRDETTDDYVRRFDLNKCVYCGLCEAACPTWAIKLTHNENPAQADDMPQTVEGRVESINCPRCSRKVPQTDLLAERIYEMQRPYWLDETGEDEEEVLMRIRERVNPTGICLECQKKVLQAEERICE